MAGENVWFARDQNWVSQVQGEDPILCVKLL